MAHISDGRTFYAGEVRRLIEIEGGAFGRPLTDEQRLETIEKGNTHPLPALEAGIQRSFETVLEALGQVKPANLNFLCKHPAYGQFTLGQLIERFLVGHDRVHVNQIQDILNE